MSKKLHTALQGIMPRMKVCSIAQLELQQPSSMCMSLFHMCLGLGAVQAQGTMRLGPCRALEMSQLGGLPVLWADHSILCSATQGPSSFLYIGLGGILFPSILIFIQACGVERGLAVISLCPLVGSALRYAERRHY